MASSFDRMKVTPQVTNDTTVKARNADNHFLRDPAFASRFSYGAVGTNPTPYVSPYSAIKAKRSWRECYTSPDKRTADSCINNPY